MRIRVRVIVMLGMVWDGEFGVEQHGWPAFARNGVFLCHFGQFRYWCYALSRVVLSPIPQPATGEKTLVI